MVELDLGEEVSQPAPAGDLTAAGSNDPGCVAFAAVRRGDGDRYDGIGALQFETDHADGVGIGVERDEDVAFGSGEFLGEPGFVDGQGDRRGVEGGLPGRRIVGPFPKHAAVLRGGRAQRDGGIGLIRHPTSLARRG